ncbi:glycoside hydrolase family 18 protein [Agrocybe pediades]|nr:glycoside hydrolase family 18 protein [Agrocybe pediades]
MASVNSVHIALHTTTSTPHPHVLYVINVQLENGKEYQVFRRYSQFIALWKRLASSFPLPPKRALSTSCIPSAWVNDELIEERKKGFETYLTHIIHDVCLRNHPEVVKFLSAGDYMPGECQVAVGEKQQGHQEMSAKSSLGFLQYATLADEPEDKKRFIAASYYPSWASDTNPPEKIDFSKFDILFYAFATPSSNSGLDWEDGVQDTLKKLVSSVGESGQGTKIVLSVGGWSGSHWYSQTMSTEENRSKFIQDLVTAVDSFGLDGIDIDWEYPNAAGSGNPHAPEDAANLLCFFKSLRKALGDSKIISAAVTQLPWLGGNGEPLSDVSEYAKYMTYVNIMNYDVFSSSAHPGPNAPLGNFCGSTSQPKASAQGAFAEWTRAGMPADHLLLGLPLYGYVSKSTDKKLSTSTTISPHQCYHARNRVRTPKTTAPLGDLSHLWGQQISFGQMVAFGVLVKNDKGNYDSANGYTMAWDDCSDTPFVYNTSRKTVVTYDDTFSFESKTKFARASRMAGCFTWSLNQDHDMALHNTMRHHLGRD